MIWYGWQELENGCWEWSGSRNQWNYGTVPHAYKSWLAHRAMFTIYNGEIPKGLVVRHKCDNPPCVNPAHLELGTQVQNIQDMIDHKRSGRKLSESDVKSIRQERKNGVPLAVLAEKYNVSQSAISLVARKLMRNYVA